VRFRSFWKAPGLRLAQFTRAIAPMISSLRMSACPAFDTLPSLSLPPDENCRRKSEPGRKI
jgi:hypothetical protein